MNWDKTSILLGLGAGLAIGSLVTSRFMPTPPPNFAEAPTAEPAIYRGPSTQQIVDEVTAALREELRDHHAHTQGTNDAPEISGDRDPGQDETDRELSALQAAAKIDGERLVTAGISRGRWTDEDGEELSTVLREMSEADADETRRQLMKALNAQELTMEARRPF